MKEPSPDQLDPSSPAAAPAPVALTRDAAPAEEVTGPTVPIELPETTLSDAPLAAPPERLDPPARFSPAPAALQVSAGIPDWVPTAAVLVMVVVSLGAILEIVVPHFFP